MSNAPERITGAPEFLVLGAWESGNQALEIVSRRKLDTRQVLPYFVHDGELHAGVLQRTRASRVLRGVQASGLEAIGFDFAGVDETADILSYGDAIFTARANVSVDEAALQIPLPSYARSIGYLTELALPLLIGIRPPPSRDLEVSWDGGQHRVLFRKLDEIAAMVGADREARHSEDLAILLRALRPRTDRPRWDVAARASADAQRFVDRHRAHVWTAERLGDFVERDADPSGFRRSRDIVGADLRFLALNRVREDDRWFEIVVPGSGVSVAMLPYVVADGKPYFLLWRETRVAALERQARQPLYDIPISAHYVNATACFADASQAARLGAGDDSELPALAAELLSRALGRQASVRSVERLGSASEPCAPVSSEVRHRLACELDVTHLDSLPDAVLLISAEELSRAVADGRVRDPVIVSGLLELAPALGIDPFAPMRTGEPSQRLAFVGAMTRGSIVQRRLKTYSSIEAEQLEAPTYAHLMTFLQHEFGVRVAYPRKETDRSFFKAAFRVFMAADREENRALQGLHWSHDAFHFALGNFTPAVPDDFVEWYLSGAAAAVDSPLSGEAWDAFAWALKSAEDEATFFSFWTLFADKLSLARHVGKLTFYEALRDMGVTAREQAREIFDAVTVRAELPELVRLHPEYAARAEIRGLFDYMLGFRDYHFKDIKIAWKYARRDPYRNYFVRFGIYERDAAAYVASVKSFPQRLERYPHGLNPLLAAAADERVALCLRVWDVVKAMKLVRDAIDGLDGLGDAVRRARRREFFDAAEEFFDELLQMQQRLDALRAGITNSEMSAPNEATHRAIDGFAAELESLRQRIWDRAAATGLLTEAVLAEERARELPR